MGSLVWIAGYPKSGNTWVRAFLANLIANRQTPLPLADLPRYCDDEARPELYSELAGRPNTEMDLSQLCALRSRVHALIAARAAGTRFVKTHNVLGSYDGHALHNMNVTGGIIYVVRNPLDVVISMTSHFGLSLDQSIEMLNSDHAATANSPLFVSQVLTSWSQHVESWTSKPSPALVVVRYEDLIEKPIKTFTKLARVAGQNTERRLVERASAHVQFKVLAQLEARDGFIEVSDSANRFFRSGKANQWRTRLSPEQVSRVVAANRSQMLRFSYVPGQHPRS